MRAEWRNTELSCPTDADHLQAYAEGRDSCEAAFERKILRGAQGARSLEIHSQELTLGRLETVGSNVTTWLQAFSASSMSYQTSLKKNQKKLLRLST